MRANGLARAPALCVPEPDSLCALADLAVQSLPSPSSRRNYSAAIRRFLASGRSISREGIQAYLNTIRLRGGRNYPNGGACAGTYVSTFNVALAAIRLLAREAWNRDLLSDQELTSIERIKGAKNLGQVTGNWLDLESVQVFIDQIAKTENGVRNKALMGCLVGCGMRRAEVAGLDWSQWQQRDGRWVWVDLRGKGGRVRTVACPGWAADLINEWKDKTTT